MAAAGLFLLSGTAFAASSGPATPWWIAVTPGPNQSLQTSIVSGPGQAPGWYAEVAPDAGGSSFTIEKVQVVPQDGPPSPPPPGGDSGGGYFWGQNLQSSATVHPMELRPADNHGGSGGSNSDPGPSDPSGQQGQLNGPTCGTISIQWDAALSPAGYQAIWNTAGCSPAPQPGQFVVLVGAQGGPGDANPFDNPQNVEGIWYGWVGPDGNVTIDLGTTNNQPGYTTAPIDPSEWFAMSVFSSSVESPAGQLPELPWAAAGPLLLGGPLAWVWARRRRVTS